MMNQIKEICTKHGIWTDAMIVDANRNNHNNHNQPQSVQHRQLPQARNDNIPQQLPSIQSIQPRSSSNHGFFGRN